MAFKSPGSNARQRPLIRIRQDHGQRLIAELASAFQHAEQVRQVPDGAPPLAPPDGTFLEVELSPQAGPTTLERTREKTRQGTVTFTEQGARRTALFVPDDKRFNDKARYALIVSLETPEAEIDLYTPIEAAIPTLIDVEIEG